MQISLKMLKKIISEEMDKISEADVTDQTLEPSIDQIMSKLSPAEQAVLDRYISELKGEIK